MTSIDTPTPEAKRQHEYLIVVDGQQKEVTSENVSYELVVELAYPGYSADPEKKFTVTYRNAVEKPESGTLQPGHSVRVKKEGTVLNVKRTTKS